jgi:hypothetical protein
MVMVSALVMTGMMGTALPSSYMYLSQQQQRQQDWLRISGTLYGHCCLKQPALFELPAGTTVSSCMYISQQQRRQQQQSIN